MKGFYYIENSISEFSSDKHCFVDTLEEAKEAMKYCADWYRPRGTGEIFFQPTGVEVVKTPSTSLEWDEKKRKLVSVPVTYDTITGKSRQFICRGCGLDENGEVKWSKEQY